MRIIEFLLIYCIVTCIGYDAMAQDEAEKIREFQRNYPGLRSQETLDNRGKSSRERQAYFDNAKKPKDPKTQLQYTIRMNRPGKYKLGEPIFICGYVKNTLDCTIHITIFPSTGLFSADEVTLVDGDGNDVPMTRTGKRLDEWIAEETAKFDEPDFILLHPGTFHRFSYYNQDNILVTPRYPYTWETVQLESQVEMELKPSPIVLNHYFDLTQSGVYYLTFHCIAFYTNKRYIEPLTSNTLMFEVLDEFVTPDDLRDPGEFNWPPPDEKEPDAAKLPAE